MGALRLPAACLPLGRVGRVNGFHFLFIKFELTRQWQF